MSSGVLARAIIVGATSAIGSSIAASMAAAGIELILVARNQDKLAELAKRLATSTHVAGQIIADFASQAGLEGCLSELQDRNYEIDCLVYATGRFLAEAITDTDDRTFDEMMRINFKAPFYIAKALVPALRATKGQIVFINSSVALNEARANLSVYTAGKASTRVLASSLRSELNKDGIRVLSVYPGRTASSMQEDIYRTEGKVYRPERLLQPADIAESVLAALRLPRTAEITDIAIRPLIPG